MFNDLLCTCVWWLDASVVCICAVAGWRNRQRIEAELNGSSSCTLATTTNISRLYGLLIY